MRVTCYVLYVLVEVTPPMPPMSCCCDAHQALLLEERRLEAHIQATLEQEDRAQAARDPLRHAWPEAAPP